jgi:hypothetical protein
LPLSPAIGVQNTHSAAGAVVLGHSLSHTKPGQKLHKVQRQSRDARVVHGCELGTDEAAGLRAHANLTRQ